MEDTRLGTILLESEIIEEAELEKCLDIQTLTGGSRPLGQILVEQGLLDLQTLTRLLDQQHERAVRHRQGSPPLAIESDSAQGYVEQAVKLGASELVVSEGRPVLVKICGSWNHLTPEPLRGPEVWDFVRAEMGNEVLEALADRRFVHRELHKPGLCRGRIAAFRQFDGVAVTLRLHPEAVRTPAELALPPQLIELLRTAKGLVLIAGEHGSGRTEIMARVLHEVAQEPSRYVLVLDDSAEFPLPTGGALVARRRIGDHVIDYPTGLRTAVREDPDALLVGDVSNPDAFDLALRAAEGGRLVVACLPAAGVLSALHRVLNFYPGYDVGRVRTTLATVLRAVLACHLLPAADGGGVLPANEFMLVDDAVRDVLRAGELQNLSLLLRLEGGSSGYSLDRSLLQLLAAGKVMFEDVFARAEEKAWVLDQSRALAAPPKAKE
ncbi:MAG TPA: ATPase, T2SS/T4P/T4SS family [Planctomycetota bacterium]|nr:ATPase, T2SS/T4P/T4SS family [Planctomycetota bacterium]